MLAEGVVSPSPRLCEHTQFGFIQVDGAAECSTRETPFHACDVPLLLGLSVRYIELLIQLHGQAGP